MTEEGRHSASRTPEGTERFHDRLTAVENTLDEVERSLNATEGKVARIADLLEHDQALADIAPEVFAKLPELDNRRDAFERLHRPVYDPETGDPIKNRGTVERLAEQTGLDSEQVREAIAKLKRDTARVRSAEVDGKTRYWKEI
jgi:hypothetical protein